MKENEQSSNRSLNLRLAASISLAATSIIGALTYAVGPEDIYEYINEDLSKSCEERYPEDPERCDVYVPLDLWG